MNLKLYSIQNFIEPHLFVGYLLKIQINFPKLLFGMAVKKNKNIFANFLYDSYCHHTDSKC